MIQRLTALEPAQKPHTHNPQTSGDKNESKNVREKLSMSPSFLHHSLWKASAILLENEEVRLSKIFLWHFSERLN